MAALTPPSTAPAGLPRATSGAAEEVSLQGLRQGVQPPALTVQAQAIRVRQGAPVPLPLLPAPHQAQARAQVAHEVAARLATASHSNFSCPGCLRCCPPTLSARQQLSVSVRK